MKFSNIRLLVSDFDTCFAFYNETLGLECTWGQPGDNYASFNIGIPSGLALFKTELMSDALNEGEAITKPLSQDKVAIILEVENVDEEFETLKSKGLSFLASPKDMSDWGIRVVHFRDPENNLIELFSPIRKDDI